MGTYFFESLVDLVVFTFGRAWGAFSAFVSRVLAYAFPLKPLRLSPALDSPPMIIGREQSRAFVTRRLAREQVRLDAACVYAAA